MLTQVWAEISTISFKCFQKICRNPGKRSSAKIRVFLAHPLSQTVRFWRKLFSSRTGISAVRESLILEPHGQDARATNSRSVRLRHQLTNKLNHFRHRLFRA